MGDIAVIGTSPVLILEAAAHARAGHDVVVFSNRQPFGGAWWVDSQDGMTGIETACHLLEADEVGYAVLNSLPGVELLPMDPHPLVHLGYGRSLRYGSAPATAAVAAIGVPAIARAGWRGSRSDGPVAGVEAARASASVRLTHARNELNSRGLQISYPRGGAATMLEGLRQSLVVEGVHLSDGQVSHIDVSNADRCTLLVDGELQTFSQAVVSSGYSGTIDSRAQDRRQPGQTAGRQHDHLLLVVPTELVRPLSYDRFVSDPVLLRASSLAGSVNDTTGRSDRTPLMLGTRRPAEADQVIGPLVTHGLLLEPVEPELVVAYTHISRDRAKELETASNGTAVDFVPTFGDLSRSLRGFVTRHPNWLPADSGVHLSR